MTKELVGLKDEMKKNTNALERLCQQKDTESRQREDQAIDRRRTAAMRKTTAEPRRWGNSTSTRTRPDPSAFDSAKA